MKGATRHRCDVAGPHRTGPNALCESPSGHRGWPGDHPFRVTHVVAWEQDGMGGGRANFMRGYCTEHARRFCKRFGLTFKESR